MKHLLFHIILLSTLYTYSQSDTAIFRETTYCAKIKSGRLIVLEGSKELENDAVLENGIIIRTYGSVLKTDGRVIILKAGECIDSEGRPVKPKRMEKMIKEEARLKKIP